MSRGLLRSPFFYGIVSLVACQPTTQRPPVTLPEIQQEIEHQVLTPQMLADFRQRMATKERLEKITDRLLLTSLALCKDKKAEYSFDYLDRYHFYKFDSITRQLVLRYLKMLEIPEYPTVSSSQYRVLRKYDQILKVGGISVQAKFKPGKSVKDGMGNVRRIKGQWVDVTGKTLKKVKGRWSKKNPTTAIVVKRRVAYWPSDRTDRQAYKDSTFKTTIRLRAACDNEVYYTDEGGVNAYTDGSNIFVTKGMLEFATDEELAIVIAHELGHCYENHVGKKHTNRMLGEIAAIALATAASSVLGVPAVITQSEGAAAGATAFSQEFELEADYIGMYLLARAGYSTDKAAYFWRKIAERDPVKSNSFTGTHPPTAKRYLLLEKTHKEIEAKKARGEKLLPNRKK